MNATTTTHDVELAVEQCRAVLGNYCGRPVDWSGLPEDDRAELVDHLFSAIQIIVDYVLPFIPKDEHGEW